MRDLCPVSVGGDGLCPSVDFHPCSPAEPIICPPPATEVQNPASHSPALVSSGSPGPLPQQRSAVMGHAGQALALRQGSLAGRPLGAKVTPPGGAGPHQEVPQGIAGCPLQPVSCALIRAPCHAPGQSVLGPQPLPEHGLPKPSPHGVRAGGLTCLGSLSGAQAKSSSGSCHEERLMLGFHRVRGWDGHTLGLLRLYVGGSPRASFLGAMLQSPTEPVWPPKLCA